MKFSIITQADEIVNYDNVLRIFSAGADIGDQDGFYVLVAQPIGTPLDTEHEDDLIQLGIFSSSEECESVKASLLKSLKNNVQSTFEIPMPQEE